ncbi:MAG: hypothetical protein JO101_04800 [Candidatus Eremiobacteraeota bacterium]|nr:hypothetical protein [Candidatus Eremiobacteraeota bacterium]
MTMTRASLLKLAFALAALAAAIPTVTHAAGPSPQSDNIKVTWKVFSFIQLVVTPNYSAGFGPIWIGFGKPPPPPAAGPGASFQGGSVDFGNVMQAESYLYKYAVDVNVTSSAAFNLYGEGTADMTSGAGGTMILNTTLLWVKSVPPGMADNNSRASIMTPFSKTTQGGAAYNNPVITYAPALPNPGVNPIATATPGPPVHGVPAPVDLYYDYVMRVPGGAVPNPYSVYVTYTAVLQ